MSFYVFFKKKQTGVKKNEEKIIQWKNKNEQHIYKKHNPYG